MESSDDLRSDYLSHDDKDKSFIEEDLQNTKPNKVIKSEKIPLRMWIIGLTAPTLFVCLCGAAIITIMYLRNNSISNMAGLVMQAPTQPIDENDTNTNSSTVVSTVQTTYDPNEPSSPQSSAFVLLDSEAAMAKISPMDGTILNLEDNANESYEFEDYFRMGKTRNYTINLKNSTYASVSAWWCARNRRILRNNLADLDISISIDDRPIDLKKEAAWWELMRDENTQCQFIEVVAHNWGEGEHTITTSIKVKQKINNGIEDFEPGENKGIYKLTVLSATEVLLDPQKKE